MRISFWRSKRGTGRIGPRFRRLAVGGGVVAMSLSAAPAFAATSAPANPADLPDPGVWVEDGRTFVYATGNNSNLQQTNSTDLATWSPISDPLPTLPAWAAPNWTWAPSVIKRGSTYVMYYTVRHRSTDRQCISVAVASQPSGPYTDTSTGPFICQLNLGGSIDPQPFVAPNGVLYLHWKSDDNALGGRTKIWGQRLSTNGLSKVSVPVKLLEATATWQTRVIEGPAMAYDRGTYYLFYGASDWFSSTSGIGYGTCSGPLTPCTNRSTTGPWLGSRPGAQGPAGPTIFTGADGGVRMAYHAWGDVVGYPDGRRSLWIDRIALSGGKPVLQ